MVRNVVIYSGYDDSDYLAHYGVKGMKWGVIKAKYKDKKAKVSSARKKARASWEATNTNFKKEWAKASDAQKKAASKYARQDYLSLRPRRLWNRIKRFYTDKDIRGLAIGGTAADITSYALGASRKNALRKASVVTRAASLGLNIPAIVRNQKKLRLEHLTGKADKRYEIDPETMKKKKYSR